ncbi:hypothetical protein AGMMS49546_10670 [Spirochaetia bacterium]|nr:hypothetical protein AGMMS49546_10670 [Spirochaetia bacterium]
MNLDSDYLFVNRFAESPPAGEGGNATQQRSSPMSKQMHGEGRGIHGMNQSGIPCWRRQAQRRLRKQVQQVVNAGDAPPLPMNM